MRRLIATVLALGIAAGVMSLLVLQRWVAEADDRALHQRPSPPC